LTKGVLDDCACISEAISSAESKLILAESDPSVVQALGWLSLFLPTHGLSEGEEGWNDRIADWMVLWESDAHNKFWRGQWMLMFAQVAKHDTQGGETTSTTFLHLVHVNAAPCSRQCCRVMALPASAMMQPRGCTMPVTNSGPGTSTRYPIPCQQRSSKMQGYQ